MLTAVQAAEPLRTEEQVIKPEVHRKAVKIADIDTESFEIGLYSGVMSVEDFGTSTVTGARATYHIVADFFLEASYGETTMGKTSAEVLGGDTTILTDKQRELSYYNFMLGYNLFPGEVFIGDSLAFNSDLYLIAGAGSTEFAGEAQSTLVYGWGYRFLGADWLSIHLDMRNHVFEHDKLGFAKKVNNLEFTLGLAVFF